MYKEGKGVKVSPKNAVLWWRKAANQDLSPAQKMLGISYWLGSGVAKDVVKARMWFALAIRYADIDDLQEISNLGYSVEHEMTPAQIAEAKRLVAQWKPER